MAESEGSSRQGIPAEFIPFRFAVHLFSDTEQDPEQLASKNVDGAVCGAAFSEVSGLEATMQPKKIAEGGRNWGEVVRVGATSFAQVTLKRGMTTVNDAFVWFDTVTRLANYGYRMSARIEVRDTRDRAIKPVLTWVLLNVLPTRFKGADLSSTAKEVAVEELQLTHEGLMLVRRAEPIKQ
jgi:phage tail-like protein